MQELSFIEDIACIMLIAGGIAVIFRYFKQPLVLGYILAGVIIGPYTPPFELIQNQNVIHTFSQLGVIFLMFSLGLEFSLQKLARVSVAAFIAALLEIMVMIWIGYGLGYMFGWSSINSLFLGGMLAISSTTIIVKALDELGLQREEFVQLIYAILIIEDILAIAILVLLTGAATSHLGFLDVIATVGTLTLFLITSTIIGLIIIPRLLAFVAKFKSQEVLLICILGLCFGFCLLVMQLKYSLVLGAFLMGAIIAESNTLETVRKLIQPLRDMFSAVFFVAIGLMLNPAILAKNIIPIAIITTVLIVGKIITCSVGVFITGRSARTSLCVGMGLAQIGEFSFIIASVGTTLGVISDFLYPIVVAVSAITTISTPYLIKHADQLSLTITKSVPKPISSVFRLYTLWLQNIQISRVPNENIDNMKRTLLQIFLNICLVAAIFLSFSYLGTNTYLTTLISIKNTLLYQTIIWCSALILSLPCLIVIFRKTQKMSLLIAKIRNQEFNNRTRLIIAQIIPVLMMLFMLLVIYALSSAILPPIELLIIIFFVTSILIALLWRWFITLHQSLRSVLIETLEKKEL